MEAFCDEREGRVLFVLEVSLDTGVDELTCLIEVLDELCFDRVEFLDDFALDLLT